MVQELNEGYDFYIYTSNTDLHGLPIAVTITNEWSFYNDHTKVWYANKRERSQNLVEQVKQIKPDVLYIIGLFDWHFNIVPLMYADCKDKLLSVRGMLHPGALGQKSFKKKIFLQCIKWMKLDKKCRFQATDEAEEGFIKNIFGELTRTKVAGNFPRLLPVQTTTLKQPGSLKMVSIGLISPMKNYLVVLQALKQVSYTVHYDIYGPVKENAYWEECLAAITLLPPNITVEYHSELPPHKVGSKLEGQHVFILPSKSENYGHAIVEALSAGLPVISSDGVPWLQLEVNNAGVNIKPEEALLKTVIDRFAEMEQETYTSFCEGAASYIRSRVDLEALRARYKEIFHDMKLLYR